MEGWGSGLEQTHRVRRGARQTARALIVAVSCALGLLAAGCDSDSTDDRAQTVAAKDPGKAFAPVVHLHPDEQFMPMGARWFIGRSALIMSYGSMCDAGKIAVGRLLEAQHNLVADWIYVQRLGRGIGYWRQVYADRACEARRQAHRYYANQLTRPREDRPDRAPGLHLDEGYYLDLMNWGRGGRPAGRQGEQAIVDDVEVWYERRRTEVDGEAGITLTYWMLYGMSRPAGPVPIVMSVLTHEGDWERVQVVLREGEGADEWEPRSIRVSDHAGGWRQLPWKAVRRVKGAGRSDATHPVLFAARGSHTLYARPGRHPRRVDADGTPIDVLDVTSRSSCSACPRWKTWERLTEARKRYWYTFGGAWGELGPTSLTTGPLGPHGKWPPPGTGTPVRAENRP